MNKKLAFGLLMIAVFTQPGVSALLLASADELKADGVYRNNEVVVNNRNPRFSWKFDYEAGKKQDSYEIRIGDAPGLNNVWAYSSTDETESVVYSGTAVLTAGTTYYWAVRVTDNGTPPGVSSWEESYFFTVESAKPQPEKSLTIYIDWNNPFNPYRGEITKIRYASNISNEQVSVRIFSLTGEYVATVAEHLAEKNALYTAEWDGRNARGEMCAAGMYFVNIETSAGKYRTVRVVLIK